MLMICVQWIWPWCCVWVALQLFRDGGLLGTTLLPNLTLQMGNNSLAAQGFPRRSMRYSFLGIVIMRCYGTK